MEALTIYQFILMDEKQQAEAAWSGEYMMNRNAGDFKVMLYKVGDFFVEIFYNNATNSIIMFKPFRKRQRIIELYFHFSMN
jgi:hypothetical protein